MPSQPLGDSFPLHKFCVGGRSLSGSRLYSQSIAEEGIAGASDA